MGYGVETVAGSYAALAAAGPQAYAPAVGQSFNVRALAPNSVAHIEALWTNSLDPGYTRIRSPRLHDDVTGVEAQHLVSDTSPLINENFSQEIYSQDLLTVEDFFTAAPTATDVQQLAFQVYYDDVPGIDANFMTWAQVQAMIQSYYGVYVLPESNATVGQWGPGVAINSEQDQFKANSNYALLGYVADADFTAFSILGTDLGNLQVGGPGCTDPKITRNWFPYLEMTSGRPSIPVINSQNKGATLVQVFDSVASTVRSLSLLFAYLGPTGA